ncbi:MAG: DUF1961 family protein [Opitutales bacterium]
MNWGKFSLGLLIALFNLELSVGSEPAESAAESTFMQLLEADWDEVFFDSGAGDWRERWTLDGEFATLENSDAGMAFTAGPEAFEDAHHAVLWTRQDFAGSLKIEYEYTRLDDVLRMTTILFIQATGSGEPGYDEDISKWADKRAVPAMSQYFGNMHLYHLSYAAYGKRAADIDDDYVRARRYVAKRLGGTQIKGDTFKTGLFRTGVPHRITVIKHQKNIYMRVSSPEKTAFFHFHNRKLPPVEFGKIGLRHMSTRSARYKDFKVSALASDDMN